MALLFNRTAKYVSDHRRTGQGAAAPTPIIFQMVIFGQNASNIRAKHFFFRQGMEKIFGQETSASPRASETGPVCLCLLMTSNKFIDHILIIRVNTI